MAWLWQLLSFLVSFGVPALIGIFAPRRWRLWALALWIVAPLLIVLAVGASEMASGKASPADLDKLLYGVLLIGSFVAAPWLIGCGVGYAAGAFLRRGLRPEAAAEATRPAPAPAAAPKPSPAGRTATAPPLDPLAPTLSPPAGWQSAHVGFDRDGLVLDGLSVWSLPWRREEAEPVMLAHPAHPSQQHRFTIYGIDDGRQATRFAAAELSNGVWGFYRWIVPADAPSGTSVDGSLRFEHDLGRFENGRYDAVAPIACLGDARSGALLFEGAAWSSSRIVPQADGSLLLALEHRQQQTILRIDPASGTFRDLAERGSERPVTALAETAAAARATCDDPTNAFYGRRVAPDGSLVVEFAAAEWANTHWVNAPRVTEIATGRVLLDLWGTDWDAAASFPRPRGVRLSLRRYHHGGAAEAEIDLDGGCYVLFGTEDPTTGPLGELVEALTAAARASAAAAGPRRAIPRARPTARNWLVALAILVGAILLIAIATIVTLRVQGEPEPTRLDTIPHIPGER
jgi:hypothetical protein